MDKLKEINLKEILKAKNPYLFKAKNVGTASEIIDGILSAYISSSEEGIFGNWLERVAIFVNEKVYNGQKAGVPGIDLDFTKDGERFMVTIKSGPVWGNDDQKVKMIGNFSSARKRFATSGGRVNVKFVNGCCYGRSRALSEYKSNGDYYKMCGQRFWELISGDANLYTELIIPLGHEAEMKNADFKKSYDELKNRLEKEFLNTFSNEAGGIDWKKLLIFNSSFPVTVPKAPTPIKVKAIPAPNKQSSTQKAKPPRKSKSKDDIV